MKMRNRVAEYRDRLDRMTQKELGELAGATQRAISHIENNARVPSVLLAMRIARVLKADIYELFIDVSWEKKK
jgi:putative transcriptional regulator